MHIPPQQYCQEHLEEVQRITDEPNWFEFLDNEDRLLILMKRSEPFKVESEKPFRAENDGLTWVYLARLVSDNCLGLWPNPTERELWLSNQIGNLNREWGKYGCYYGPEFEVSILLRDRYQRLIDFTEG